MDHAQKVKDHFNAIVPTYTENFSESKSGRTFEFRKRLNIVSQLLKGRSGRLLECACGTGEITKAILGAGHYQEAVICDISGEMLGHAKNLIGANQGAIDFVNSEIFAFLEKDKRQFDVIVCLGLIAHTGQLEKLLHLFKSHVAPNGCVVLQSSLAEHVNIKFMRALFGKRLDTKIGYPMHYFTTADIQNAAGRSGLSITASRRYAFALPFGDRFSKPLNYYIERAMETPCNKIGSECIMLLEHR